jgi:hypothetical protein
MTIPIAQLDSAQIIGISSATDGSAAADTTLTRNSGPGWTSNVPVTFPVSGIILTGSSGRTAFASLATGARTITFPDATDMVALLGTAQTFTAAQTRTITDSATSGAGAVTTMMTLDHETSGTPGIGYGLQILGKLQDTTTASISAGAIQLNWLVAAHASASSQWLFQTISNAGALSTALIAGSGISGATAGMIVGGAITTFGGIWATNVTPSPNNYAVASNGVQSNLNAANQAILSINGATVVSAQTSSILMFQPVTTTITAIGTAQTAGNTVINTTAAAVGAQQYSPMSVWQGQGWETTDGASKSVAFGAQCVPVQGTALPTGNWVLSSNINAAGWTTCLTVGSTGNMKQPSGATLTIGNAAVTGLTAGVLAATTNASIVITDQTGQAYRIPCII